MGFEKPLHEKNLGRFVICVNCGDQIDKKYEEAENINRDYDYILNHLSATLMGCFVAALFLFNVIEV